MTNKPEEGPHVPDTVALLEAQAREIAEKDARIAELEAALKDLREAAYDIDEMDMLFSQRNEWGCCLAKADAALKGEAK